MRGGTTQGPGSSLGEGPFGLRVGRSLAAAAGAAVAVAMDGVGRLRRGRPLHPVGAVLHARLVRHGGQVTGASWIDEPGDDVALVRLSRGGGFPAPLPDVHGLALRTAGADVLLSTTMSGPLVRFVPLPVLSPGRLAYSSVMPFDSPTGPVLLAARPVDGRPLPADLPDLAARLADRPWRLDLQWARLLGPWQTFGRLEIGGPVRPATDGPERFEPSRAPAGLTVPDWIARLRTPSYRVSRRYPTKPSPPVRRASRTPSPRLRSAAPPPSTTPAPPR